MTDQTSPKLKQTSPRLTESKENLRIVDEQALYQDLSNENKPPTPKDERRINWLYAQVIEIKKKQEDSKTNYDMWKEDEYTQFYEEF